TYEEQKRNRKKNNKDWIKDQREIIEKRNKKLYLLYNLKNKMPLNEDEKKTIYGIFKRNRWSTTNIKHINLAITKESDTIKIIERAIETHIKRKQFSKENYMFELNRNLFYKKLGKEEEYQYSNTISEMEIHTFWGTMWNAKSRKQKEEEKDKNAMFGEFIYKDINESEFNILEINEEEVEETIRNLPNWKAGGCDKVYNFFIKQSKFLWPHITKEIEEVLNGKKEPEEWFYTGLTFLIPKVENPESPKEYRPITCMPNLYKLCTKICTKSLTDVVEKYQLLSENQMGTVRNAQGAKEQGLINKNINKCNNDLKTMWIDVKKAYDSIDHEYMKTILENLALPSWIKNFIKNLMGKWNIQIIYDNKNIIKVPINRGILQGDSLSPILFVLCMEPLSKFLNNKYPKIHVSDDNRSFATNHLLFIDDLKLMAREPKVLKSMCEDTMEFLKIAGLEKNQEKSATNEPTLSKEAKLLEDGVEGYKYLGVLENSKNQITEESINTVKTEVYARIKRLVKTKLNAKNLFKAINEHALSLLNYYIGLIELEPEIFKEIDQGIRNILTENKVHIGRANKQRLYLSREELGRGLEMVEFKSERILLNLNRYLQGKENSKKYCIKKSEEENKSHLGIIKSYLKIKYNFENENFTIEELKKVQKALLYKEIEEKIMHKKLFESRKNIFVDMVESSRWLKTGNISPVQEAFLCLLQDRNILYKEMATGQCNHCQQAKKTVDHLATRCEKMLYYDYTLRHNEVIKAIHLMICNRYNITNNKHLRTHSVQHLYTNDEVDIRIDTRITTDINIANNKPDVFIYDKKRNLITIIEVGITSQNRLQEVEVEKKHKYDILANALASIHNARVQIIPIVMTWDGIVTKFFDSYCKKLGIKDRIRAYMQYVVLKRTLESIVIDFRRNIKTEESREDIIKQAITKIMEEQNNNGAILA
ncbi:hypothetical protein ENBRE01_3047, partial [Enteropsectra breve]